MIDRIRSQWQNLTSRERALVSIMGAVLGALMVLLPAYLLSSAIASLSERNDAIVGALRQIGRGRERLAAQRAEQQARQARHKNPLPVGVGAFLSKQAEKFEGLTIGDSAPEPEREIGQFRVRHTRVRVQNAGLRSLIRMLADTKNTSHPIAIERIHIDHHSSGDQYNVQIGVLAFEQKRRTQGQAGATKGATDDR